MASTNPTADFCDDLPAEVHTQIGRLMEEAVNRRSKGLAVYVEEMIGLLPEEAKSVARQNIQMALGLTRG